MEGLHLGREIFWFGREMGSPCTTCRIPRPLQPSKQTRSLVKILIDTGTAPTVCRSASTLPSLQATRKERSCPGNCVYTSVAKPGWKSGRICCIYRAQDKHFSIPPAVPWAAFLTSASSSQPPFPVRSITCSVAFSAFRDVARGFAPCHPPSEGRPCREDAAEPGREGCPCHERTGRNSQPQQQPKIQTTSLRGS